MNWIGSGFVTIICYANNNSSPAPPSSNDFILLDSTDFLLLDGTNFLLLEP
jgi:hypothetical protein